MRLPLNLHTNRTPHASFRLKPEATQPIYSQALKPEATGVSREVRDCIIAVALVLMFCAETQAQGRTDVVTLGNGDRITGEILELERGRLEFKTDDAGTLYLEWDKLASVVAARLFEVELEDGTKYLGNLGGAPPRSITVVAAGFSIPLQMSGVTRITPIGTSFWRKIDGSIDAGFSYTRSSGVAQLNLNWDSMFRRPASTFRTTLSLTATAKDDDEGRDDRGSFEASYLRYP
jgi:hypothetical protein